MTMNNRRAIPCSQWLRRATPIAALILAAFLLGSVLGGSNFLPFAGSARIRGSGDIAIKTVATVGITSVELQFEGTLTIEQGDVERLEIEAEDNLLEYIDAQITNGLLVIRKIPERMTLETTRPIHYHLTLVDLESVKTTSSGSIEVGDIEAESFTIEGTSSGDIDVGWIRADGLQVTLSSSGSATIRGGVIEEQVITLSSSGVFNAPEVKSQRARIRLSSSGDAYVNVTEQLEADLTSSGNVYVIGEAIIVTAPSSSTGTVIRSVR